MVHTGYNPALVALSVGLAVFASYTALDLGARVRGPVPGPRWPWIVGAALAMGGGIWAMHFVGMLAFAMDMPGAYDLGLTALSLAIAVGATGAAFLWVAYRGDGTSAILVAGPLMGLGVAGMHYTGMAALRVPGHLTYDPLIVGASLGIAITAATGALWLAFRQHGVWQKLAAACVMGVAVAGMHYTGMAAATFTADAAGAHAAHGVGVVQAQQNLALYVAGATAFILFLAMLASSLDQQRVQRDLQASEARFRAAIQAVRGVLWTNDATGRMIGEQPGWSAITGQTRAEYENYGWADAVHPDDAEATLAAWNETVRTRSTFVHEHRVRAQDGGWRHYAIRAIPVLDASGAIREWVGVHTDITEQREAEADLRESNEEIQRYAYIVSHDLRAPLVNVMGFTSELEETRMHLRTALEGHPEAARIDTDMGEALSFIQAAVNRMEALIAAILKLSREGRRQFMPERLDMTALLRGVADSQRHQTEAAGAVVTIAPDLPTIVADRLAVEQVFANLLDNAVKYLDPSRPGRITVDARSAGPRGVCFSVADNGRGIAARDHTRVFELFRRSGTQDRPGEGIGLAHVKALVRSFGGRIEVDSHLGTGTTFRGDVAARHGYSQSYSPGAGSSCRRMSVEPAVHPVSIVMIEDDEGHARLIERNIRRAGVNNDIVPFRDGTSALEYLLGPDGSGEVSARRYLLILLDLNLPDMTGLDILEKVKANPHTRRSPVVVLTTTDDSREIQRCYDLGANVYITKPVNYDGFANAIRQLGLFFSVMQVPETP